jgi:hypothetical protein
MIRRSIGALLLAAASAAGAAAAGDLWLAPAIAVQAIDDVLPSRFEVRLKDGSTASLATCADVVRLDATITEESSGNNVNGKAFQSARVRCQALDAVKTLQRARRSLLPAAPEKRGLAAALKAAMPARLYLAISEDSEQEVRQAQARGLTLKQFRSETTFRQSAPDTVRIEVDDTVQDVQLLARGDFNGDGAEDWLLRVDSRVVQGSYGSSSLWLVTRLKANRPLLVLRRWP